MDGVVREDYDLVIQELEGRDEEEKNNNEDDDESADYPEVFQQGTGVSKGACIYDVHTRSYPKFAGKQYTKFAVKGAKGAKKSHKI